MPPRCSGGSQTTIPQRKIQKASDQKKPRIFEQSLSLGWRPLGFVGHRIGGHGVAPIRRRRDTALQQALDKSYYSLGTFRVDRLRKIRESGVDTGILVDPSNTLACIK
ncbi:hypothetical protein GQ600_22127 [Phytophthora cactorum]|nr:hypothetical protein GQ600_22127 [Phytophthora cactorum]